MPLRIEFQDILRATLPVGSGNEGWIGVSPSGNEYHVVVPVDVQIARGVMAGNLPQDGTPFGGYTDWIYFRCPPYEAEGPEEETLRHAQATRTARDLVKLLASYLIEATCVPSDGYSHGASGMPGIDRGTSLPETRLHSSATRGDDSGPAQQRSEEAHGTDISPMRPESPAVIECPTCSSAWRLLGRFLRDPELRLDRYEACAQSFREGVYVFSHACGGEIRLPVSRFARPRTGLRSLIGTHACPGFCYYRRSAHTCEAACEGAIYRRIASAIARAHHGTEIGRNPHPYR
ncbi:MAG: hypothetical protein AB1646_02335 [Thermodesulfobacteriota bacterium]